MYQEYQIGRKEEQNNFIIQKTIYNKYLRLLSDKVIKDQSTLIIQTSAVLDKFKSTKQIKDLSEWDIFSTRQSVQDDENTLNISVASSEGKGKISRKNILINRNGRDNDIQINDALNEVEQMCSIKTSDCIRLFYDDYRKITVRLNEAQKKQRQIKQKDRNINELSQKNLILSNKIQDIEHQINKLKQEILSLRQTNTTLKQKLQKKSQSKSYEPKLKFYEQILNNSNLSNKLFGKNNYIFQIISDIYKQRQININQRLKRINQLQKKYQQSITKTNCQKCCPTIDQAKHKLVTYRSYLQKQGKQIDQIIQILRKRIFQQNLNLK